MKINPTVRNEFDAPQSAEARNQVKADPGRLGYHLMPPVGWLNDPNGLCQFNGIYNIFYQYTPGHPQGADHRGWGHYQTRDFVHYQELDDPFVPDTEADGKGSYSGSALVRDGKIHFFYTGNNKLPGDYDYINSGRIHWVVHSESLDGIHFSPKEVLMKNADYPQNLSCHVRDPKIYTLNGVDYMVLGARTKDSKGQVEVFKSEDESLRHWKPVSTISAQQPFGYMWECPDLFDLDGHLVLMTCPQGVDRNGLQYENIYQNGWFEVNPDLDHDQKAGPFTELDYGFDFYAPQSFEDEKGRRILIGWMGIPDADYTNPTTEHNWQHALSLPRALRWENGQIAQSVIEEIEALRQEEIAVDLGAGSCMKLPSSQIELDLEAPKGSFTITFRKDCTLSYDASSSLFVLDMGTGDRKSVV